MAPPRRSPRRSTYAIHDFDTGGTSFPAVAPGSGGSWTLKVAG